MPLITWDKKFSVNVVEIDEQHKNLIMVINELDEAINQGKGKEILGKILSSLIRYTETHFKTEEDFFIQYGYADKDNHKKEHDSFVQKISDILDDFDKKEISLSLEVLTFLTDWLQNHINGTDKKYSQFFNEKGLK